MGARFVTRIRNSEQVQRGSGGVGNGGGCHRCAALAVGLMHPTLWKLWGRAGFRKVHISGISSKISRRAELQRDG